MTRFKMICGLVIICVFLSAATCNSDPPGRDLPATCEGVMCTMMFAAVNVQVQDATGKPVLLDSTYTLNPIGVKVSSLQAGSAGIYTVVDDSYQKALAMRTEEVMFTGYKDGKRVIEQRFKVTADCCHVSKSEGPAILTIK